jgi:hypothetical protein
VTTKRGAARPGTGTAPSNPAASTPTHVDHQGRSRTYSSTRRLLAGLVDYVPSGRDRPALDRLTTAAGHAAELVDAEADRVAVVASLPLAGEAAGLPRRRAEAVVRPALRGAP